VVLTSCPFFMLRNVGIISELVLKPSEFALELVLYLGAMRVSVFLGP